MRDAPALQSARGHMAPLDGLRGLAILMVMAFHFAWVAPPRGLPAKLFVFLGSFGWAGVDLFFVLSGFLITGILLDSKPGPSYFRNFYARRVLRIFPLYYGVLLVTLVVLPRLISYDTPELKALLAAQGWLWLYSANVSVAIEHGRWVWNADWLRLGMLWSLAVEEHFYLVWPLLVFVSSRKAMLRASVAIIVALPLLRAAMWAGGVAPDTIYCLSIFRVDALAFGGLLALVVRDPALYTRVRPLATRVGGLGLLIVLGLTARARWFTHLAEPVQVVGFSALAMLFGSVLLAAVSAPPTSLLRRALTRRELVFCGKYSYGAYMLHELLRPALVRAFPPAVFERVTGSELAGFCLHALCGTAATFALAVASFELFERRFLGLKRFFEYRPAPTTTPAVPSES
ncbi:MAG: acyltransferase [Myxococcota bacterium]|nr:acyltransferase [Myxococcota bacterium]